MTLTMHQRREIAARIAAGESRTKLADEFGVTVSSLDDSLASLTAAVSGLPRGSNRAR
ncbi:Uncharacterised protein [Mycobacteroides abscessus subsp. abscessus]|nr:Uncharacterised protein [Mycobacteroides abscessus subsp. abscessus]